MAIYEFKCQVCGNTGTVSRSIDSEGDIPAPNCAGCGIPMERVWSLGGISFKGEGWGHQ
jgi:putative FmdB family regulatory protein